MIPTLQFLGGAGTVTGSKFLVRVGRRSLLVDCGLFQGLKDLRLQNWAPFAVDPVGVDAVLLTHAHLDHTGYLPLLVQNGFGGPIYCTHPTRELTKLILSDSAKIQEEDAEIANRLGYSKHHPARALYGSEEVKSVFPLFKAVPAGTWVDLFDGIRFRFTPSGHIIGSAFIELQFGNNGAMKTIVFSGDIGRRDPLILNPPGKIGHADVLLVESTYGDRVHSPVSPAKELARVVNETVEKGGQLLIPAFAVGRTQDVLYLLSELKRGSQIPDVPVFLDSPMGIDATEIFTSYPEWHRLSREEVLSFCRVAQLVKSGQQSQGLMNRREPSIIIAGSGMMSGGRILGHLMNRLSDARNTVLIVGFQAAFTRGRLLRDGITELKIYGQYVPVHARIEEISNLSAHADQHGIIEWMRGFENSGTQPQIHIVHGEPQAADALRVRIRDALGWTSQVAKPMSIVEI